MTKNDKNNESKKKKDFYEAQINEQKKSIRKNERDKANAEKAEENARKRLKSRQKRIQRIKKIKLILKTTRLKTFQYLKRCLDPKILLDLAVSFAIIKKMGKMSTSPSDTMPSSPPQEIHRNMPVSGQVKQMWEDHWPTIVTTGGMVMGTFIRDYYLKWKIHAAEKQLFAAKNQIVVVENQLEVAQREQRELVKSKDSLTLELQMERRDYAAQLAQKEQDFTDFKLASQKERDTLIETHQAEIQRLYGTLNRFNNNALRAAKKETAMRKEIQQSRRRISALVEERDLLKEKIIQIEKDSLEKDNKIHDLVLQNTILEKKIDESIKEQADLKIKLQNLQKINIFNRRKYNKQLKKERSNCELLRSELHKSKTELNTTTQQIKKMEDQLNESKSRLSQSQEQIHKLIEKGEVQNRKLQLANAATDQAVKQMDKVARNIESLQNTVETVEQDKLMVEKQLEKTEDILEIAMQKNEDLEKILHGLRQDVDNYKTEQTKLRREIAESKNSSKENQKQLKNKLKKNDQKLKKAERQTRETEYKLIDSYAQQQDLADKILDLKNRLDQERVTNEQQETHFYATLLQERAEQEQRYYETVRGNEELVNAILDQQDQSRTWWQKILSRIRITPQLTINTGKKKPTRETIHRFYPSGNHEHLYPEEIIETEYESGRKEIRCRPSLLDRATK